MTKVTICIPTYNNVNAFKRCLDSILMQDFKDFDIIITDDSDNNDIYELIQKTDFFDIKYQYGHNKKALHSPENWNSALRLAKGEYIKLMHHDDWFTYDYSLKIFVELLDKNPSAILGFVTSKNIDILTNEVVNYNIPTKEWIETVQSNPLDLINGNRIGAPSAVIHRNHTNLFYDKNLKWFVDIEFYVQLLKHSNHKIVFNSIDAISIGVSDKQISATVRNNPYIVVYEFFYFLNKWQVRSIFINKNILKTTSEICSRFQINCFNKIRYYGYDNKLPFDLIFLFIKFRIMKLYNKISKKIRSVNLYQ